MKKKSEFDNEETSFFDDASDDYSDLEDSELDFDSYESNIEDEEEITDVKNLKKLKKENNFHHGFSNEEEITDVKNIKEIVSNNDDDKKLLDTSLTAVTQAISLDEIKKRLKDKSLKIKKSIPNKSFKKLKPKVNQKSQMQSGKSSFSIKPSRLNQKEVEYQSNDESHKKNRIGPLTERPSFKEIEKLQEACRICIELEGLSKCVFPLLKKNKFTPCYIDDFVCLPKDRAIIVLLKKISRKTNTPNW